MTMNPSGHDIIGMSLIDAFAQRGYRAELTAPDTVAVTLKDGNRAQADIAQWRQHAGRNPRSALPGIAAQYADQAVQAFERQAPPPPPAGGSTPRACASASTRRTPSTSGCRPPW
ncbi:hypothetical protein [Actinomadura madurae]|uniref:hypothetical protein n=1 Tax=Actinomadura madurae TaxID=1993 RepID=UPI0003ACFA28|nr:hypothetical protein [Actinomadura madurae]MCP9984351.1 hypothetical protein [Actinomadura madurae]